MFYVTSSLNIVTYSREAIYYKLIPTIEANLEFWLLTHVNEKEDRVYRDKKGHISKDVTGTNDKGKENEVQCANPKTRAHSTLKPRHRSL